MRYKYAYPSNMDSKRPKEYMDRLEAQIKNGKFDPIPITLSEYQNGILSEGKHRLIIAKKLKINKIPIQFP